jgi:hypothetical protein
VRSADIFKFREYLWGIFEKSFGNWIGLKARRNGFFSSSAIIHRSSDEEEEEGDFLERN